MMDIQYSDDVIAFNRECKLDIISNCTKRAGIFGGEIFGDYLRDVIVARKRSPNCDVEIINKIFIWFKCQEEADRFLDMMGSSLIEVDESHYNMIKHGMNIVSIYIVILPDVPVSDINVNLLTYNAHYDTLVSYGSEKIEEILQLISEKRAVILGDYVRCDDDLCDIKRNYLQKGWRVTLQNSTKILPDDVTLEWITQEFNDIKSPTVNKADSKDEPQNTYNEKEILTDFNSHIESLQCLFLKLLKK